MPDTYFLKLWLHVCLQCGHVVDKADSSPARGCFGNRYGAHARAERVKIEVEIKVVDGRVVSGSQL